jgi:hypothetical protein
MACLVCLPAKPNDPLGTKTSVALDHHDELMANWQRGVALMPIEMISGADNDD